MGRWLPRDLSPTLAVAALILLLNAAFAVLVGWQLLAGYLGSAGA